MELGLTLIINVILVGLYTLLLIALSVDEARQGKRAAKDLSEEKLNKAA